MQRIQSLDLAKGFTVLIMPSIHVVMLYSSPAVQQSWLGDILAFIAEGPGAQLFMLLMGVGITFSSRINPQYVLQRTFYLWGAAFLLNFLKFIIPLWLGWMPQNLLDELHLQADARAATFFLFIGDILHFAAIVYPLLFLISRLKHYPYWSLVFAVAIMLCSPLVWDITTGIGVIDHALQLAGGHPPQAFFPVFPWLVYPLVGLATGYYLRKHDTATVMKKAAWIGALFLFVACLFPPTQPPGEWLPFYRTQPADTLFHLGFVMVWIAVIHWLSHKTRGNVFFDLLVFCSKNITSIYIIQWVLICWGMGFAGYGTRGFAATFLSMSAITILTLLLARLAKRIYATKNF